MGVTCFTACPQRGTGVQHAGFAGDTFLGLSAAHVFSVKEDVYFIVIVIVLYVSLAREETKACWQRVVLSFQSVFKAVLECILLL